MVGARTARSVISACGSSHRALRENPLIGGRNRLFQLLALYAPGAMTTRIFLHRLRGVGIGEGSWIGTGALIETSQPWRVEIGAGVSIGIRSTIIGHFREAVRGGTGDDEHMVSVRIEDDAFIGPGAMILPNVTIGYGAVVTAGSVVTQSVPPLTMVQGNPAKAIARCGTPLGLETPLKDFLRQLRPL
jgi:acetyltransferase-like isoleucine patch superfamily enzyme